MSNEMELRERLATLVSGFRGTEGELRAEVEQLLLEVDATTTCAPLVRVGGQDGLVCVHLRSNRHVMELAIPFTLALPA